MDKFAYTERGLTYFAAPSNCMRCDAVIPKYSLYCPKCVREETRTCQYVLKQMEHDNRQRFLLKRIGEIFDKKLPHDLGLMVMKFHGAYVPAKPSAETTSLCARVLRRLPFVFPRT